VVVNGIMLGLSPREARRRFDQVIEFAELEDFVDLKLKNYSSGMHVRLAFSVMIQVDADILLIDEVLAVGDAAFQQKCFDVFHDLRAQGRTILFVTHDMGAVERFCDRAMLLEEGRQVTIGEPREVAARYIDLNFRRETGATAGGERSGDGGARILDAWVEDASGERSATLMQGQPCTFRARVRFETPVEEPEFRVAWVNAMEQNHFVASTANSDQPTGSFSPGEEAEVALAFDNALAPGRYHLSMVVARPGGGQDLLDRVERILSVIVAGPRAGGGLVDLPHRITIDRSGPRSPVGSAPR
jgi:ABC-type multidrug transport system ATPase subunit